MEKYVINYDYYYDPDTHFWIKIEGTEAKVGMSPLVQETSGSFVAILFESIGHSVNKGNSFGTVEAEKFVGPLSAPISGIITEVNNQVMENPRLINQDPYGEGWLVKMNLTNAENEVTGLIQGHDKIAKWFESELEKFKDKGWIAQ